MPSLSTNAKVLWTHATHTTHAKISTHVNILLTTLTTPNIFNPRKNLTHATHTATNPRRARIHASNTTQVI